MDRFTKILIISGLLTYVAFVFAYESNIRAADIASINKFATSIAPVIGRLNNLEHKTFLRALLRISNQKQLKIFKSIRGKPDKVIFSYQPELSNKSYFDLLAEKVIPAKNFVVPIIYKGTNIGYLQSKMTHINLFFDFLIGLIIFLSLSIAHFYKKVFDGKALLEERVLERSAQVIEYENKLATIIKSAENGIIALN